MVAKCIAAEIPGFTYVQHALQKIRECPFLKCFQKGEQAFFIFQKCLTLWPRDLNWVTCSLKSAMSWLARTNVMAKIYDRHGWLRPRRTHPWSMHRIWLLHSGVWVLRTLLHGLPHSPSRPWQAWLPSFQCLDGKRITTEAAHAVVDQLWHGPFLYKIRAASRICCHLHHLIPHRTKPVPLLRESPSFFLSRGGSEILIFQGTGGKWMDYPSFHAFLRALPQEGNSWSGVLDQQLWHINDILKVRMKKVFKTFALVWSLWVPHSCVGCPFGCGVSCLFPCMRWSSSPRASLRCMGLRCI